MTTSRGVSRSVRLAFHRQRVTVEMPDGRRASMSYPGMLVSGYEEGRKVYEKWLPLARESTEVDDERLIEALHEAILWQNYEAPR